MPGKSKQNLPLIKRVRACRIYTYDNQKYLDFFQESGKDILGSNPKGLANALKNEIEKGNYCNYPSGYEKKVLKALHELAGKSIFSSCFFAGFHDMLNYVSLKEGRKKVSFMFPPYFGKVIFAASIAFLPPPLPGEVAVKSIGFSWKTTLSWREAQS